MIQQIDDAVAEVFERMFGRSCTATHQLHAIEADISARIHFSGALKAECAIEFPSASAQKLTSALLGPAEGEWDVSMITDAVGELCNMIAGKWKNRLGASAWGTDLSVPFISRGSLPEVPYLGATRMRRIYVFDDSQFEVNAILFQTPGPP